MLPTSISVEVKIVSVDETSASVENNSSAVFVSNKVGIDFLTLVALAILFLEFLVIFGAFDVVVVLVFCVGTTLQPASSL